MRRITLALVSTVAVLVLLFSYRTSTSGIPNGSDTAPPGIVGPAVPTEAPPTGSSGTASPSGAAQSGAAPARPTDTMTVNGSVVDNGYGPVQVRLQITAGRITDVTTLALPEDGHSRRINSQAVPQLRQEVLSAQDVQVDTVSGATATTDAYLQSIQAALDAAHLGGGS
ncbi:FMN-binding protein [Micromonospora sp. NPDC048909]|uniref:FMN-binding protein n=1 Tax=Micromonospora sp. NPDC048909 TaxID=3155643 RepID=UPI0034027CA5